MSGGKPRKSADPLYLLLREGGSEEFNRRAKAGESSDFRGCDFRGVDLRRGRRQYRFFRLLLSPSRFARPRPAQLPIGRREPACRPYIGCLLPAAAGTRRDRNVGASRHPNAPEIAVPHERSFAVVDGGHWKAFRADMLAAGNSNLSTSACNSIVHVVVNSSRSRLFGQLDDGPIVAR